MKALSNDAKTDDPEHEQPTLERKVQEGVGLFPFQTEAPLLINRLPSVDVFQSKVETSAKNMSLDHTSTTQAVTPAINHTEQSISYSIQATNLSHQTARQDNFASKSRRYCKKEDCQQESIPSLDKNESFLQHTVKERDGYLVVMLHDLGQPKIIRPAPFQETLRSEKNNEINISNDEPPANLVCSFSYMQDAKQDTSKSITDETNELDLGCSMFFPTVEERQHREEMQDYRHQSTSPPDFVQALDKDILGGRSSLAKPHPGHSRLRQTLALLEDANYSISNRSRQTLSALDAVKRIHNKDGRFLNQNPGTIMWFDDGFGGSEMRVARANRVAASATKLKCRRMGSVETHAVESRREAPDSTMTESFKNKEKLEAQTNLVPITRVIERISSPRKQNEDTIVSLTETYRVSTSCSRYVQPSDKDILGGRSSCTFHNVGDQHLRRDVLSFFDDYMSAPTMVQKSCIILEVIKRITHGGGRFLKQDPESKKWFDAGFEEARMRVSRCFRDACVCIEKISREKNRQCARVLEQSSTKAIPIDPTLKRGTHATPSTYDNLRRDGVELQAERKKSSSVISQTPSVGGGQPLEEHNRIRDEFQEERCIYVWAEPKAVVPTNCISG